MSNAKLFFGGVPCGPDVKRIREAYNDEKLEVGVRIPYSKVSEIINAEPGSVRFRCVTMAWRKTIEKETGLFIGTADAECFVVLSESEKLALCRGKVRTSVRSARRAYVVSAAIDKKKLTDEEKTLHDHIAATSANIIAMKQIRPKAKLPEV